MRMSCVNNKTSKKSHGEILSEIAHEFRTYLEAEPDAILVREEALAMVSIAAKTIQILHKVVGVTDLYAWARGKRCFYELAPVTIKATLTHDKNADKQTVADALEPYVGQLEYETDDLSDAVAVGIAWLLHNGWIDEIVQRRPVQNDCF